MPPISDNLRLLLWIIAGVAGATIAIFSMYLEPHLRYILSSLFSKSKAGRKPRRVPFVFWLFYFISIVVSILSTAIASTAGSSPISQTKPTPVIVTVVITTTPFPTPSFTATPNFTETPTPTLTPSPVVSETPLPTPTLTWLEETYQEKRVDSLFGVITAIVGIIFAYSIGVCALLLVAWKKGSTVFSRSWLTKLASKPLLISPGIGKWALFLGYKKRLQNQPDVARASTKFFGVPGIDSGGNNILPDSSGMALIESIAKSLDFQKPVLVEAKGGGGKTTLLARWSHLALNNGLPVQFKGYQPIFITPAYYTGNLIDSIASVLRERDGVAIDKDMAQAQLESGKYLILFDGVSEIIGDQNKGLQEILRVARNADYRNCRFIITTRPGLIIPLELNVFRLQPLSADVVLQFLPLYRLDKDQEYQVKKQLSLFGEKPIEPLLFSMIIEQGRNDKLSSTRSQLYERFFRKQLRVTTDTIWEGWRTVLGEFAKWFMLETGRRGMGVIHETLIDKISSKPGDQNTNSLFERIKKYYQLPVESELNLLEKLQASAVFQRSKRWQFAHDTYEEYFAACYIISYLTNSDKLPSLGLWTINDAQSLSFVGVIEFIKEMADEETLKLLLDSSLPALWKSILETQSEGQDISRESGVVDKDEPLSLHIAIQAWEKGEITKERYIEAQQWNSWQKWNYLKQEVGWQELRAYQSQEYGIVPFIKNVLKLELTALTRFKSDTDLTQEEKEYKRKLISLLEIKKNKSTQE